MKFCPNESFEKELHQLIKSNILKIESSKLEDIYKRFRVEFDGLSNSPCKLEKEMHLIDHGIPENAYLLGLDLPIWFNNIDTTGKKIIILGIDPLRNEKTFKSNGADFKTDIVIGTPYALHQLNMRNGRTKEYWEFINNLAQKNFVYVTDIYKLFFYEDSSKIRRSYDYYPTNRPLKQIYLLEQEIDLIEPDLIITLGAKSYFQLTKRHQPLLTRNIIKEEKKVYKKYNVIPMVHLSGSTRKQTKLNFLEANEIEYQNKSFGKYYFEMINNYINNFKF